MFKVFFLNYQQCSNSFFRPDVRNQMESRNFNSFQSMFELFIRFNPTSFFVETFVVVVFLQKRNKTFFLIPKPQRFVKCVPTSKFFGKEVGFAIENCDILWTKQNLSFTFFFKDNFSKLFSITYWVRESKINILWKIPITIRRICSTWNFLASFVSFT